MTRCVSPRPIQRPLRRQRQAPLEASVTALPPDRILRSTAAHRDLRCGNLKSGINNCAPNGLIADALTVAPRIKATASLRLNEDFLNAPEIPSGPLDDLADLLDDHLNNALDGLMSDPYSSCSDCHF